MIEPFSAWVDFQEQMIKLQREQLDAAKKAVAAGGDMIAAQEAAQKAARANLKAWKSWLDLWTLKR